jgi:hypothetical protein
MPTTRRDLHIKENAVFIDFGASTCACWNTMIDNVMTAYSNFHRTITRCDA